eukprot:97222-Prymnesium_polylepis.2
MRVALWRWQHTPHEATDDDRLLAAPLRGAQPLLALGRRRLEHGGCRRLGALARSGCLFWSRPLAGS